MKIDRSRRLSLRERVVIGLVDFYSRAFAGLQVPMAEEFVRTYGVDEYLEWISESTRIAKLLAQRWGEPEAQMIISSAGLWTGCRWCATSHMLLANLLVFVRSGELGPIDELELPRWQELRDPEVLERLDRALVGRWAHMAPLARRLYDLRIEAVEPQTDDDYLLLRASAMWSWISECTILQIDVDPQWLRGWGRVARDRKNYARYREARARQRSGSGT